MSVSFQKAVNRSLAPGLPGGRHNDAPAVVTAYVAAMDLVPGTFVCALDGSPRQAGYQAGGVPVGIVTRDAMGYIPGILDGCSDAINAGLNVQVAAKGEFIVRLDAASAASAAVGMRLAVPDPADGIPAAVADNAAAALDWWIVDVLDAASGLVAVSSWRKG